MENIEIKNGYANNLKNITLTIPRDKLTSIIGPSGSGKSTLAFDILYNEANRKFLDALSLKNKALNAQLEKAAVDEVTGLSPAISIQPRKLISNVRSTVGTATDIYNLLRLLFKQFSIPHCPKCKKEISVLPVDTIIKDIAKTPLETKIIVMAPVIRHKKGNFKGTLDKLAKKGFIRFEIDGDTYLYEDIPTLNENKYHDISLIIDRFKLNNTDDPRISEGVETALEQSEGFVIVRIGENDKLYSQKYSCVTCDLHFETPDLPLFSYNHPRGACPKCHGLGHIMEFSRDLLINKELSINEGGILYFASIKGTAINSWITALCKYAGFSMTEPLKNMTKKQSEILFHGSEGKHVEVVYKSDKFSGKWKRALEGIITQAKRRYKDTNSDYIRKHLEQFMTTAECPQCKGDKLNEFALNCLFKGKPISYFNALSISSLKENFEKVHKDSRKSKAAFDFVLKKLLSNITDKLTSLCSIGLGYLSLDRTMPSLSGGEESRIQLASQINTILTGVTYILDEPSTGLHHRDMNQLLKILNDLTRYHNTVIVVEHDETLIKSSEHIVELGPGAGTGGGEVIFNGNYNSFSKSDSPSYKYLETHKLSKTDCIPGSEKKYLEIKGASEHNLKQIDVNIPLNSFSVICGVSGSGKSSLVHSIIYPYIANRLMHTKKDEGNVKTIKNYKLLDSIYYVDQSPIGRNARSNPATYLGIFDEIRRIFASLGESKTRGYSPNRFSFNSKEGRCEKCQGLGTIKVDMNYMPDIYLTCDVCNGRQYKSETLQIKLKEKNMADILKMTFKEAYDFFENYPNLKRRIGIMKEIGLDYLHLGQPAPTLSGGESQRLKIALELGKKSEGNTLYILDEPTNGLHFSDIKTIKKVFNKLTEHGNTLVVIEHNLDIIANADYIIELGPEGGNMGGELVFQGFISEFYKAKTITSRYLK